jgi:hypothetical protein
VLHERVDWGVKMGKASRGKAIRRKERGAKGVKSGQISTQEDFTRPIRAAVFGWHNINPKSYNNTITGDYDVGILELDSKNAQLSDNYIDITTQSKGQGVKNMSTGIVIKGDGNKINENVIKSERVGVDVEGDNNEVLSNEIEVQTHQLSNIIKQLKLPENLPKEHLLEAIEILSNVTLPSEAPSRLESSNLKNWLHDNGFNMAFWANTAISLCSLIKV